MRRPHCELPIIQKVDVIVLGGSTAGVAAAEAASKNGAKVFLVCGHPYLGEDVCGTYRLWDTKPSGKTEIETKLFHKGFYTPNEIKKGLEDILLTQNIPFLLCSYISNILLDASGNPAGVILANCSGEQVVQANIVIDATERAVGARLLNVPFTKYPLGKQSFEFTVLGNKPKSEYSPEILDTPVQYNGKSYRVLKYKLNLEMEDDRYASFSKAEQKARDITWDIEQVDANDLLFQVPPDHIEGCKHHISDEADFTSIDMDCFSPQGQNRLYVLGGCADISRASASRLLEPSNMLVMGERIGIHAAKKAKEIIPEKIHPRQKKYPSITKVIATQNQEEMRPQFKFGRVQIRDEYIPVIGKYDVVVMGGGTAGPSAAISAARQGVKTLLIEYVHGLGGQGTMGYVGGYFHGYRQGFTKEIDDGVMSMGGKDHPRVKERSGTNYFQWVKDWKMEWYRREIRNAGGDIWFGALGCGAVVQDDDLKGVVVATPQGKGIVLSNKIIDTTGSNIAIAAGAEYEYTGADTVAIMGAGVPPWNVDDFKKNTDWTFIDDTDIFDVTRAFLAARNKFQEDFDIGKLPQIRERRRIKGDFWIMPSDVFNNRTYPDTISYHKSSYDTHGFTVDPFFTIKPPEGLDVDLFAEIPLRSLLPKGLKNILVTGLGISAHRDAIPVLRMQADLQNQGYAAGLLAAEAVMSNKEYREVNFSLIQKRLVEIGNLPDTVLGAKDNYPPSVEKIKSAIETIPDNFKGLATAVWNTKESFPLISDKLRQKIGDEDKLIYAYVLGSYGYPDGWALIRDAVNSYTEWDKGWGFFERGGPCSRLDGLIMALGKCRKPEGLPAIFRIASKLTVMSSFSHFRAIAEACENIKNSESAPVLSQLLKMPGVSGHALTSYDAAIASSEPVKRFGTHYVQTDMRDCSLRELILARALYKCGDQDELGEFILHEYANDLRGHYARHARGILKSQSKNNHRS